jgi:glycerophosphoryl diester phosphodiesterase
VQQRLPSLLDHPIAFAHRGARAHAPENTLEAFALALRLGATGLESDVWVTADGVAVLDHDGVVRRGLRRQPVRTLLRAALPPHIPTLSELFERCGTDYHLSLDVKDAAAASVVVDLVRTTAPDLLGRLWLCSGDLDLLGRLRHDCAEVRLVDSTRLGRIAEGPERRAHRLQQLGVDAINLHHSDWTGGLTTLFHRFGRAAFAWDLQYQDHLRPILRMGMDAVYSDWVDRMMEVYRDELGRPDL